MKFTPIKITAYLCNAIAVSDDWSPALDGLLEWLILDQAGLTSPNPSIEDMALHTELVREKMPLKLKDIQGAWYWSVSSPCYQIATEEIDKFRKRWDYQDHNLNWGKRKAKWASSEGAEKNYDLPLFLRVTPLITWFAVGDKNVILALLNFCKGLGKKRSYGYGQVIRWEVEEIKQDWHLWRDGQLMRPIPYQLAFSNPQILQSDGLQLLNWGWRPCVRSPENKALCVMPNIVKRAKPICR